MKLHIFVVVIVLIFHQNNGEDHEDVFQCKENGTYVLDGAHTCECVPALNFTLNCDLAKWQVDENIIENPLTNYSIDPRGIGRIYYDCMLRNKEKIAQICAVTGETLTYGDILKRSIRVAINLRKRGVEPGDVVAISIYTHTHSTIIVTASLFLGAVVVGIDEDLPKEDIHELLQQVTPKIVFVIDKVLESIISTKAIVNSCIVLVDSVKAQYTSFDEYLEPQADEDTFQPFTVTSLQDTAVIFFTSGTTGLPKGFTRSHLSLITSSFRVMDCSFCWDVIMDFSTPAWTVHLTFLTISIYTGSARVIYRQFSPEHYWDFARHKTTTWFALDLLGNVNRLKSNLLIDHCFSNSPNSKKLSECLVGTQFTMNGKECNCVAEFGTVCVKE
ncbi:hypothetical protein FQR65_LT06791 [Abscondita terminalis]|nr:hypothetical protein FQR65_LT06791 [Abscondita terminalis]